MLNVSFLQEREEAPRESQESRTQSCVKMGLGRKSAGVSVAACWGCHEDDVQVQAARALDAGAPGDTPDMGEAEGPRHVMASNGPSHSHSCRPTHTYTMLCYGCGYGCSYCYGFCCGYGYGYSYGCGSSFGYGYRYQGAEARATSRSVCPPERVQRFGGSALGATSFERRTPQSAALSDSAPRWTPLTKHAFGLRGPRPVPERRLTAFP